MGAWVAAGKDPPVCANLPWCQAVGQGGSVLGLSVPEFSLSLLLCSLAWWRFWFSAGTWKAIQVPHAGGTELEASGVHSDH